MCVQYRRSMWMFVFAMMVPLAGIAGDLVWRLENPFRLFRDKNDFDRLKIPKGVTISDWFAGQSGAIKGHYLPYRNTYWDPVGAENTTGQYAPGYARPTSHQVVLTWKTAPAGQLCDWTIGASTQRNVSCAQASATVPYDLTNGQPVPVTAQARASNGASAQTTIVIRDRLIVGLGDSYSAGQGSPDRPSQLTAADARMAVNPFDGNATPNVWFPVLKSGTAADWWDHECNRSLLSWQVLATLKLASEAAHQAAETEATEQEAFTFVSYACSGAEFYDGVFTRQVNPPGKLKMALQSPIQRKTVQRSQLHAAARDLCADGQPRTVLHAMRQVDLFRCAAPRRPDAVLLSVGGNDAGFARVIMHQLMPLPNQGNLPHGKLALAAAHKMLRTVSVPKSGRLTKAMAPRYALLGKELHEQWGVQPASVLFMAYPNPLMRPEAPGQAAAYCGLEMRAGMEAARESGRPATKFWWHFWANQAESGAAVQGVIIPLTATIKTSIPQWTFVDGHLPGFQAAHGMCADAAAPEADSLKQATDALAVNVAHYGLPRYTRSNDGWITPATLAWHPYDPTLKRWIRTPNDSLRTQTTEETGSSISGAFHPTGAGYAAMGDAAYVHLRATIDKVRAGERR